jgi:Tfp pilus assembly protein PilX
MENKLINKNKRFKDQKGQVILIVMLVSALVLTLGLSASRQATVETKIDTDEEMLKKAFNTAESGVDYYLGTGITQYTADAGTSNSANLSVTNIGGGSTLASDGMVSEGNTEVFWLMGHDTNGNLNTSDYYQKDAVNICSPTASGNFKVDYFYKVSRSYQQNNVANCLNSFSLAAGTPVLLAITPINFQTSIYITGNGPFPIQGEEISSVGQVGSVNTVVRVLNKYQVPIFMLDAITSEGNVLSQ